MSAPLSDSWVVEYHFLSDTFSVTPLRRYLREGQRCFLRGALYDGVLLALYPSRSGAREECEVWQERRDSSKLTMAKRLAELRRYVAGLESIQEAEGDSET